LLVITHDQTIAARMSRVVTLADGAITGDSKP
jgi:predicted ABC-type transport system involved in lysophospholipase L1 biosynthesis ATPase subunit